MLTFCPHSWTSCWRSRSFGSARLHTRCPNVGSICSQRGIDTSTSGDLMACESACGITGAVRRIKLPSRFSWPEKLQGRRRHTSAIAQRSTSSRMTRPSKRHSPQPAIALLRWTCGASRWQKPYHRRCLRCTLQPRCERPTTPLITIDAQFAGPLPAPNPGQSIRSTLMAELFGRNTIPPSGASGCGEGRPLRGWRAAGARRKRRLRAPSSLPFAICPFAISPATPPG